MARAPAPCSLVPFRPRRTWLPWNGSTLWSTSPSKLARGPERDALGRRSLSARCCRCMGTHWLALRHAAPVHAVRCGRAALIVGRAAIEHVVTAPLAIGLAEDVRAADLAFRAGLATVVGAAAGVSGPGTESKRKLWRNPAAFRKFSPARTAALADCTAYEVRWRAAWSSPPKVRRAALGCGSPTSVTAERHSAAVRTVPGRVAALADGIGNGVAAQRKIAPATAVAAGDRAVRRAGLWRHWRRAAAGEPASLSSFSSFSSWPRHHRSPWG